MFRSSPDIYKMLDTLTLEMKEELLEYLKSDIAAAKAAPEKSYLESQWDEIKRLIECLKYEPYIDDQMEIEEIWIICEEMIKSGKLKNETWETRLAVIKSIISDEDYDSFGVIDPIHDLFEALMFTLEEKIAVADLIFKIRSPYMMKEGARLYKECGHVDKYIEYQEQQLQYDQEAYMEIINYYRNINIDKAVEIAELGMKKCQRDQTEIIIFLLQHAREIKDEEKYAKLIRSAKLRAAVDFYKVQQALQTS